MSQPVRTATLPVSDLGAIPPADHRPISDDASDRNDPDEILIKPAAFLRTMLAIAWTSLRHPCSVTSIDLSTGRVIEEE